MTLFLFHYASLSFLGALKKLSGLVEMVVAILTSPEIIHFEFFVPVFAAFCVAFLNIGKN